MIYETVILITEARPHCCSVSEMVLFCGPVPPYLPCLVWLYLVRSRGRGAVGACANRLCESEWFQLPLEDVLRTVYLCAAAEGNRGNSQLVSVAWLVACRATREGTFQRSQDWNLLFSERDWLHRTALLWFTRLLTVDMMNHTSMQAWRKNCEELAIAVSTQLLSQKQSVSFRGLR